MKLLLLALLISLAGCSTLFPNRMDECKGTCLRLLDKNATIKFKAETDEHFCVCEGEH